MQRPQDLPEASTAAQLQELGESLEPQQAAAPRTNVGAIPAPDSPGFLDRALKDPEFYAANRDKVMQAWKIATGDNHERRSSESKYISCVL